MRLSVRMSSLQTFRPGGFAMPQNFQGGVLRASSCPKKVLENVYRTKHNNVHK